MLTIGGNISVGNTNFGNHSLNNTNANHWDTNARYASGGATLQTGTGASLSMTPGGDSVLNTNAALSNLGVSVRMAESVRTVASSQAQSSISAAMNKSQAAGEQYSAAFRKIEDYAHQKGQSVNSGGSYSSTETTGSQQSAHQAAQLIDSFDQSHHVGHERAMQVFGQLYADSKMGLSGGISGNVRSAFGSTYTDAKRFAADHNFVEVVDAAKREAKESHYREGADEGTRLASSIASSFDRGDSFRREASSQLAKANSYSKLASESQEKAASIDANYTQDFFKWMHHQLAPSALYGQGKMSDSAIDNMAAHDIPLLQDYANRFVEEKTKETVRAFDETHHLSHGAAWVEASHRQQDQRMTGQAHVEAANQHYIENVHNKTEQEALKHAVRQSDGLGVVNTGFKEATDKNIQDQEKSLQAKNSALTQEAAPFKEKVDDRVKGQVIGSLLHGSSHSLIETIRQGIAQEDENE